MSRILSQSTNRTIKFSILVHIEHFPSFITSKAEYDSVSINFNNTEWYIRIELYKYCQTSNKSIYITPSSPDQPETFGAFVCGMRGDQKACSFIVNAIFKFKRPSTAKEIRYSHEFSFNSTKHYAAWGSPAFAKIDVILNFNFCQLFLTTNFRIFWTRPMAIWLIIHLNCSLMYQSLNVNRFCCLLIIYRRWIFESTILILGKFSLNFNRYTVWVYVWVSGCYIVTNLAYTNSLTYICSDKKFVALFVVQKFVFVYVKLIFSESLTWNVNWLIFNSFSRRVFAIIAFEIW